MAALIVSVSLGFASDLLFAAALQLRPEWFADPVGLVAAGEPSATLLSFAALADLCGYYLPTAVVALGTVDWLRERGPRLADGALVGAIGYVVAGSIGAVMLAVAGPSLMRSYSAADSDQSALAVTFGFLVDVAVRGIWQVLDGVFIAAWMIGNGLLVRRVLPGFARLSIGLGVLFLISAAGNVLGLGLVRDAHPRDHLRALVRVGRVAGHAGLEATAAARGSPCVGSYLGDRGRKEHRAPSRAPGGRTAEPRPRSSWRRSGPNRRCARSYPDLRLLGCRAAERRK